MTEVNIYVLLEVDSEDRAEELSRDLQRAAEANRYDLTKSINSLHKIKSHEKYPDVNIESIRAKSNEIQIIAYSGITEPVTWFSQALSNLGARKLHIREQWDEGGSSYYFLNGKKVSRKRYLLGQEMQPAIEVDGFLISEDRIFVRARLISFEKASKTGNTLLMEFVTDKDQKFYYRGQGELTELVSDDYEDITEFRASFEKGTLKGLDVSFAKRPTQVAFSLNKDKLSKEHPEWFHTPVEALDTEAKCPFCGSALRSERAKQCPSCYKSWRDVT